MDHSVFGKSQFPKQAAIIVGVFLLLARFGVGPPFATGQLGAQERTVDDPEEAGPQPEVAGDRQPDGEQEATDATGGPLPSQPEELSLLWLLLEGGPLMIPIGLMSVFVVTLVIERAISLRRAKVMPPDLIRELGKSTGTTRGFDPRHVYRLCQQFPSATSTVIRAMLLKVGRPHSEVEHAVAEASEREADRLYSNVRWLNLAAAISPLLGLLGTVWGMIRAFFDTTQLQVGQNKADFLASGIYVALVTTLGGLAVAIPAAIFAHYFEGRIQGLFHRIDELLFNLLPQVERYEGRVRVSRQSLGEGDEVRMSSSAEMTGGMQHTPSPARAAPK